jgi:putative membrane protein
MKIQHYLYFATLVVGLQACQNTEGKKGNDQDSLTATDSLAGSPAVGPGNAADAVLTDDEKTFIVPAAIGGMMEVETANLILQKSDNKAVKEFAAMMVKDHTKANQELAVVAKDKSIGLPTALPAEQTNHIAKMKELTGRSLDVSYVTMMIDDHANTVALFENAARYQDPALKNFVVKTLPVLQMHNKMAVKLGKDLNITNANNGDDFPNVRPDTVKK